MNKNIFLQKSKEKYNPDVLKKNIYEDINRKQTIFKKTNIVYNSITNNNIEDVKTQKDLELPKDNPLTNIESIFLQKKQEREEYDNNNKPIKQKILVNENVQLAETFNELKDEQTNFSDKQKKIIETNKNKFDDIMKNLKNMGILNS